MKLSTAIIAGMQTVKLVPGNPDCDIFGAALRVVEPIPSWPAESIEARYDVILGYWPWLERKISVPERDYYGSLLLEIEYRFDQQVCHGYTSLNELLNYIRSLEPPCAECCSFGCICEQMAPLFRELVEQQNPATRRADAPIHLRGESSSTTVQLQLPNDGISGNQRGNIVAEVFPADVDRRFPLGWERLETARTTLELGEAHGDEVDSRAFTPAGRAEKFAKWRSWERFGRLVLLSWLASLGLMLLVMAAGGFWEPAWGFWLFSVPAALFLCTSAVGPIWLLWPYLWALRSVRAWQELFNELGHNPFDLLMAETRRGFVMRLTAIVFMLLVLPACLIAACDKWL